MQSSGPARHNNAQSFSQSSNHYQPSTPAALSTKHTISGNDLYLSREEMISYKEPTIPTTKIESSRRHNQDSIHSNLFGRPEDTPYDGHNRSGLENADERSEMSIEQSRNFGHLVGRDRNSETTLQTGHGGDRLHAHATNLHTKDLGGNAGHAMDMRKARGEDDGHHLYVDRSEGNGEHRNHPPLRKDQEIIIEARKEGGKRNYGKELKGKREERTEMEAREELPIHGPDGDDLWRRAPPTSPSRRIGLGDDHFSDRQEEQVHIVKRTVRREWTESVTNNEDSGQSQSSNGKPAHGVGESLKTNRNAAHHFNMEAEKAERLAISNSSPASNLDLFAAPSTSQDVHVVSETRRAEKTVMPGLRPQANKDSHELPEQRGTTRSVNIESTSMNGSHKPSSVNGSALENSTLLTAENSPTVTTEIINVPSSSLLGGSSIKDQKQQRSPSFLRSGSSLSPQIVAEDSSSFHHLPASSSLNLHELRERQTAEISKQNERVLSEVEATLSMRRRHVQEAESAMVASSSSWNPEQFFNGPDEDSLGHEQVHQAVQHLQEELLDVIQKEENFDSKLTGAASAVQPTAHSPRRERVLSFLSPSGQGSSSDHLSSPSSQLRDSLPSAHVQRARGDDDYSHITEQSMYPPDSDNDSYGNDERNIQKGRTGHGSETKPAGTSRSVIINNIPQDLSSNTSQPKILPVSEYYYTCK